MTVLFPPVLETQGPSIRYFKPQSVGSHFLEIRFALPSMLSRSDFSHAQVVIKYAETGRPAVNPEYSPDRATLFINAKEADDGNNYYFDQEKVDGVATGNYIIRIPYYCFANGAPAADTVFLVQVRFGANPLWSGTVTGLDKAGFPNFARWRQIQATNIPSGFGEWSNLMKVYCYGPYSTDIKVSFADFLPEISWTYQTHYDDPVEQVKITASFNGFNKEVQSKDYVLDTIWNGTTPTTSGVKENIYTAKAKLDIAPVVEISIKVKAITKNNTQIETPEEVVHSLIDDQATIPWNFGKISDPNLNTDAYNGCISKTIRAYGPVSSGETFSVYRMNTLTLNAIKILEKQPIILGEDFTFEDYTVEMGEDYQYAIIQKKKDGTARFLLNNLKPFGTTNPAYGRLMRMEHSFLTDKHHQLKLAGDVSLSSYKRNVQDAFQTTIGSKYPFYVRASEMNYRTFSLSGLVTINFDENATFLHLDTIGKLGLNSRISEDDYIALMNVSPGLEKFFAKDAKTNEYIVIGKPSLNYPLENEEILGLINRCSTTIIKNGLWWNNGEASELLVQKRDLNDTSEFSLSRRRFSKQKFDADDTFNGDKPVILETTDSEFGDNQLNINKSQLVDPSVLEDENLDIIRRPDPTIFKGPLPGDRRTNVQRMYTQTMNVANSLQNGEQMPSGPKSIYGDYYQLNSNVSYGTSPTDELIYIERKFRDKVMEWLSDGKPKLFRSETEGNMIVQITNVSFSPYKKSGRMVYTMSCTATEIAEFNTENLFLYDLVPNTVKSVCFEVNDFAYTWGHKDSEIVSTLQFVYSNDFDIPNMQIDVPTDILNINLSRGVRNGSNLTFTAIDPLPPGIVLDSKTGIITGYPRSALGAVYRAPSTVTIKVDDVLDGVTTTATIKISVGYIYNSIVGLRSISITGKNGAIKVGDQINPITVTKDLHFAGGVPSYRFSLVSPPPGITIDSMTGVITGYFAAAVESGTSYVRITDRLNQWADIPLTYDRSYEGLIFVKLKKFDRGYLEEKEPIEEINCMEGVSGGRAPYYFYCDSVAYPLPEGLSINANTGVISGAPRKAARAGEFQVSVRDDSGDIASILISYNTILEEFYFEYTNDINVAWVNGALIEMTIGYKLAQIDVSKNVHGGLKFTDGYDYRYESEGLLPNFGISQNGYITGEAQVGKEVTQAYLYVTDARGKRVPVTKLKADGTREKTPIRVSKITTALTFAYSKINISGLLKGNVISDANVECFNTNGTSVHTKTIRNIESIISGGVRPYNMSISNSIKDITLQDNRAGDSEPVSWEFTGTANEVFNGTHNAFLIVGDSAGNKIQVPVFFESIYEELTWDNYSPVISGAPGDSIQKSINGVKGGVPPFSMRWQSVPTGCAWEKILISTSNVNSWSNWVMAGSLPADAFPEQTATIIAEDSRGKTVSKSVRFLAGIAPLKITLSNSMRDLNLMANHSTLDQDRLVATITGGEPGTAGYLLELTRSDLLPAGFTLEKLTTDGSKWGFKRGTKPLQNFVSSISLASYLVAKAGNAEAYPDGQSWYPPTVYDKPKFGNNMTVNGNIATYQCNGLQLNMQYISPPIFEQCNYPGITVKRINEDGFSSPPLRLEFIEGTTCFISGVVEGITQGKKSKYQLTTPSGQFTPSITMTATIFFSGVVGPMRLVISPADLEIPAMGINKKITNIDLSNCLSGGIGDFSWTAEGLPNGLRLNVTENGRKCVIEGTPTTKTDPGDVKISVTDNGQTDKLTLSITIRQGGVFEPIRLSPKSITLFDNKKIEGGTDYVKTLQELGVTVSGGNGILKWEDTDASLMQYTGLTLSPSGRIGDRVFDEAAPAITFNIYVKDEKGQVETLQIISPGVIGALRWIPPQNILIPTHKKGFELTFNPPLDFSKYVVQGKGGQPSYEWWPDSTIEKNTPSSLGFTVTEDPNFSVNGKITKIKYPSTATPAGSFYLKVSDSMNSLKCEIQFGEVTEK